jgi:hypothetical protein
MSSSSFDAAMLRFRIILPVVYLVLSAALFCLCFLHLGHSVWCEYFLQSMFPGSLLRRVATWMFPNLYYSKAWQILDVILTVLLPYLLTVAQYFLLGKLIDHFLRTRTLSPEQKQ